MPETKKTTATARGLPVAVASPASRALSACARLLMVPRRHCANRSEGPYGPYVLRFVNADMKRHGSKLQRRPAAQHALRRRRVASVRLVQHEPGREPGRRRDALARTQDDAP